jgi:hypothetical protein
MNSILPTKLRSVDFLKRSGRKPSLWQRHACAVFTPTTLARGSLFAGDNFNVQNSRVLPALIRRFTRLKFTAALPLRVGVSGLLARL